MTDLPPHMQERIVCSIQAAVKYEAPANILLAVAEKEGGKPGQWVKNSNDIQTLVSVACPIPTSSFKNQAKKRHPFIHQ